MAEKTTLEGLEAAAADAEGKLRNADKDLRVAKERKRAAQAAVEKIAQAYQRFLKAEQAAGRRRVMTIGG